MIELKTGNLLEADVEALVNTVNCVGVMGKGIALQFSKKFPKMLSAYKEACKEEAVKPGAIHVYEQDDMLLPRYIFNFPTKRHWKGKSRLEDVESGLDALAAEIEKRQIKSIAIPPLGCGHGGLDWKVVDRLIREKLAHLTEVKIWVYPPTGDPEAKNIVHNTERPKMNPSRAICLKIWQQYFALGYQLSLLEVHKLLYFLQEAGEPLRLRFEKQTYGPYADNLRHLLHRFEGHFTLGFGDGRNAPETRIELQAGAVEEANAFLEAADDDRSESLQRLSRVENLIDGFESPYGMELLATVHWANTKENAIDLESLQAVVERWNDRKRKLMTPRHLELAWSRLKEGNWVREVE